MRNRLCTSILASTLYTICVISSSDGERKLQDEGSTNELTTSWGTSSSQKSFLDTSHLNVLDALEIEIDLPAQGKIVFNSVPGVPSMIGFFHGETEGQGANIYQNPETNNIYGSIVDSNSNEIHQISTNSIGEAEVITKNVDDFSDDDAPMAAPKSNVGFFGRLLNGLPMLKSSSNEPRVLDDSDTLDIMVVWTKKAECKNSGLGSTCALTTQTRQNMMGKITLAVDETNTAFALSGVGTQLRLVQAYLHGSYEEGSNTNDPLQHLTKATDGVMDDVHAQRAKFGADLVSLWVDVPSGCGLAWVGPHKDYMFSVVNWSCATGYFSFGHELVHNIGCNHDRGTEDNCNDPKPNYGYRDPNAQFRDIMSYNCASACDNVTPKSCSRVQRFSNTVSNYEGAPIGDYKSDCASHINNVLPTVVNYYPAKTNEQLVQLGQFLPLEGAPTQSPTSSNCKTSGQQCNSHKMCCNQCRWRRCT